MKKKIYSCLRFFLFISINYSYVQLSSSNTGKPNILSSKRINMNKMPWLNIEIFILQKMFKPKKIYWFAFTILGSFLFLFSSAQVTKSSINKSFGEIALKESTVPIRPGEPGKVSFWNKHARQFIYAPAFDYKAVNNATTYRFRILSAVDNTTLSFENKNRFAPLSAVWASVPVGYFNLEVIGLSLTVIVWDWLVKENIIGQRHSMAHIMSL